MVRTRGISPPWSQVQCLVGELRSCKPRGVAPPQKRVISYCLPENMGKSPFHQPTHCTSYSPEQDFLSPSQTLTAPSSLCMWEYYGLGCSLLIPPGCFSQFSLLSLSCPSSQLLCKLSLWSLPHPPGFLWDSCDAQHHFLPFQEILLNFPNS